MFGPQMFGPWPPHRRGDQISPTAHYTGYTWVHHGMSDTALETVEGKALFYGLASVEQVLSVVGAPTVEGFLLARHRAIDANLRDAIDDGSVDQIIEIAGGLSGRGFRFRRDYGDEITYIEIDLPYMVRLKRSRLERLGAVGPNHRIETLDALADSGRESLSHLAGTLEPNRGTAIITEGLVNYFDRSTAEAMFARFARALDRFPRGIYLSDLYLAGDTGGSLAKVFSLALSTFVRGRVHVFYDDESETCAAVQQAGFDTVTAIRASEHPALVNTTVDPASRLVRIVRATI